MVHVLTRGRERGSDGEGEKSPLIGDGHTSICSPPVILGKHTRVAGLSLKPLV